MGLGQWKWAGLENEAVVEDAKRVGLCLVGGGNQKSLAKGEVASSKPYQVSAESSLEDAGDWREIRENPG